MESCRYSVAPHEANTINVTRTIDIPLDPGGNTFQLRVHDHTDTIFSETPALEFAAPDSGSEEHGRLFVLAIGINNLAQPALALNFAVADAEAFARTIQAAGERIFSAIDTALLTNQQATREGILDALDRLGTRVRPDDTFLLYVASHGVRNPIDGRFLLIPQDIAELASWQQIAHSAIDETALIQGLAHIRAKHALLLLDTCDSGALAADTLANVGHQVGRYLLAASTSRQDALDSYDNRNGVFIYALREGFEGRAPHGVDNIISALALGEYVSARVGQLARQKGHDQDAVFKAAQEELHSFPIGELVGISP